MSENELEKLVQELRGEVSKLQPGQRSEISNLLNKLENYTEKEGQDDEGLLDELQESIRELEVSYPTLTEVLNQIMTALSSLGI